MSKAQTLGAELRRFSPDYPTEFLRAAHQKSVPYTPSEDELALVEQRWLELKDDIRNHVGSRSCKGSFSLLIGRARWNAELDERTAADILQCVCWPVAVCEALEYKSNPLHDGWLRMQCWALKEELLVSVRVRLHEFLDEPDYWLDVKALPDAKSTM